MINNNINTWVTSALIQYVKNQGGNIDLLFEISDCSPAHLTQPDRFVPNEVLIILFAQARKLLGDPRVAYGVGFNLVQNILDDQKSRSFSLLPEARPLVLFLGQWLRKLFPIISVKIESISRQELIIRVSKKLEYLHTHDYCLFIQGFLEGAVKISGGILGELEEESCLVPVDRAGRIDGKTYRLDDQGQVWANQSDDAGQSGGEYLLTKSAQDNSHQIEGTVYAADHCHYRLAWKDSRSWPRRIWSKSGGRLLHFFKVLKSLEKNRVMDPENYQQITDEWKYWAQWESSYSLTKSKYLAYLGVLCLATLPVLGHFYDSITHEHYRALLTIILSSLILILGFLISKIQLDHSRNTQRQHEESQQFLQHAGVGVTMISPDFTIEYANPLIVNIHGEVTGRKCYEAFRWEYNPCPLCPLQDLLVGINYSQGEIEHLNKDGQSRCFHGTATPILDSSGQVTSMILVSTDVTDRKLLELELSHKQAELEASEARYRNFTANAADAILITDLSHKIIEVNKKGMQLLGGGDFSSNYINQDFFKTDLLPEKDRRRIRSLFHNMIEDLSPRAFETRLMCPDGRVIEIDARAIPILKNGKVAWVQSIFRDVTERKQEEFEKTLLLSISNAIKDAPDLEAMIDKALKGICVVMNVPFGAIFLKDPEKNQLHLAAQEGMSRQAIQKLATVAVDSSATEIASRTAILKRPLVIHDMKTIKARPETKKRIQEMGIASLTSVPMLMEDQIQGVIQIASRDPEYFDSKRRAVINQVANELAVGIAKQRLHDVVREKNRELIQKNQELENATLQLLQSEKMASIGQLAAGVAHEINNPMGFINSNLNLLNDYCKDLRNVFLAYEELEVFLERSGQIPGLQQIMDRLNQIKETIQLDQILDDLNEMISESIEGAERVTNIVQNLKEFSHPDIDKPQMADIHESLDNALKIVWNELKYKAEVKKDYGDIPLIPCYPQELKQVFMNLLVNASQAIESRGEINIRTYCNNGHVDVEIQDTGIGMTHDQITKIFDPFYTTKEVGKGTGLGLSISYRIAQKHGGLIRVLSKIGKGSIFIVELPMESVTLENNHDRPEVRTA